MKLLWNWLAFFVAFCACQTQDAQQQEELSRALGLLLQMPECARTCLLEAVAASGITAGNVDIASSCSNTTGNALVEECAMAACTIREQLTAKNITETLCKRPIRDSPRISVPSIVGGSFAALAYLLRVASKIYFPCQTGARIDNDLWWDDATITFSMALLIPLMVLTNMLRGLGLGRDVWTIPFDDITQALHVYYFGEILYLLILPSIKIAILCTYLRIFQQKQFRALVYASIGANVAYAIAFVLITVFQCTPVDLAWKNWDRTLPGRCNNINAQSWASAAFNIALDLVVVILPMPMLWRMKLNPRKKFLVMLMFGMGFFVTFVSVLRLRLLVKFGDSKNITYDYKQVGYWTSIEVDTALICACMPGIRNLIRRAFPKLMGQTVGASSNHATGGLSGRTAVGSGIDKDGVEAIVRPRHSDDDHFIPLKNISSQHVNETVSAPVSAGTHSHVRNFSRPHSPPESAWNDWDGVTKPRPLSPT